MKVILLRDVAKIGRRSEIKEVPSGHALNFLIPKKLAEPATPENLRRLKDVLAKQTHSREVHKEHFEHAVKVFTAEPLVLHVEANEKGHLFKGLHASDVWGAARTRGIDLEENEIVMAHPIKEVGEHNVTLRMGSHSEVIRVYVTKK